MIRRILLKISFIDISTAVVTASAQTYTGSALTPSVTVTLNGSVIPSTGYDVQYSNNTNAGTATITITGKGNYTGTATGTFTINKASRTLSFSSPTTNVAVGSTVTNTATVSAGSGDGTITYSSGTTSVATVNSSTGAVTGVVNGSSVITATISEGTNYLSASTTYTISVIAAVIDFNYTGSVQSATLGAGTYKLETWGAQGGSNAANSTYGITAKDGGKGGYSVGQLTLTSPTTVYVFVGGQGSSSGNGGWNGGGGGSGSSSYNSTNHTTTSITKTPIWRRTGNTSDANIAVTLSDGGFTATKSAATSGKNIVLDLTMCSFPVRVTFNYSGSGTLPDGIYVCSDPMLVYSSDYKMVNITGTSGSVDLTLTDSSRPFCGMFLNGLSVGGSITVSNTSISYSKTVTVTNDGASKMGCGGGSTDIALTTSSMSYSSYRTNRTSASYLSRMIVAGGGAGGAMVGSKTSGFLTGLDPSTDISGGYNTGACFALYGLGLNDWEGYAGKKIIAVKLNVYYAAVKTIQIGVVRNWRTTIQLDSPVSYNPSDVEVQNLTVSGTGVQTITLPTPIVLGANDWIGMGNYNYSSSGGVAQLRVKDIGYGSRCTLYGPYDPDTPNKLVEQSALSTGYSPLCVEFLYEESTNNSQVGYVGGGTSGGGYSSTYQGKQTSAGTNGAFGYGANQTSTNYRYAPACGGGGWYGGGSGSASDSSMTNCEYSGGGSGFVNTSANSSYRPSGYTGLQLDSGATYDGSQTFKSPSGTNETGHSGNGYARISPVNTNLLEFEYTGSVETQTLPAGKYKIEAWGAQGGSYSSTYAGGKGGYSVGELTLSSQTTLYIRVGGQGTGGTSSGSKAGGFNGGGKGYSTSATYIECGGGGASDVRIGQDSLYARVLVAGGGGGAGSYSSSYRYSGGYGGGTTGGTPSQYSTSYKAGTGGSQTAKGTSYYGATADSTTYGTIAAFGVGAGAGSSTSYQITGGGGGWYGGGYSRRGAGGGGSGYVYKSSTASNYPSGCLLNSSYYLANANTYDGNTSNPSTSGGTETGHAGNGFIRITKI